jgi:hypothetical protein|tara:strand:+ start:767 stop:937 length:171 start_codon:yes stop_codon:yes gene_type:complete
MSDILKTLIFVALLFAWFSYPVDGKPLSTHTSPIAVKFLKQVSVDFNNIIINLQQK